jgi:hypothetical protein
MRTAVQALVVLMICVDLAGCSRKQGTPNKSDIEAKLTERLKLKRIALADNPAGGYTGTATGEDGTKYELKVTHDDQTRTLHCRATSDKGDIANWVIKDF